MNTENPDDFDWWYSPYQVAFALGDALAIRLHDDSILRLDDIVWESTTLTFTVRPFVPQPQPTPTPGPTATPTPVVPGGVPEPSTFALLGGGLLGGIAALRRRQGRRLLSLLAFLTVLCIAGNVCAAELRVIRTGTGDGLVTGDGINCDHLCRADYPEHTAVQLKAEAFPESHFVGWFVNGQQHEGVLIIEQNTVVQARFDANTPPDDLTVFWYDGDVKRQATSVLDEVAIFIDTKYEEQLHLESAEELDMFIENILKSVHPQAEITAYTGKELAVKLPKALDKDAFEQLLSSLNAYPAIESAQMIFYQNPDDRDARMVLGGDSIFVDFPDNYTEEQIQQIETTFQIKRVRPATFKNSVIYQAGNNVFKTVEIARKLYESGLVNFATPSWNEGFGGSFVSAIPNDMLFKTGEQWNLQDIDMTAAWDISLGKSSMIAIVDTGVQICHYDLVDNHSNDLKVTSYDFEDSYDSYGRNVILHDYDPSPSQIVKNLCLIPLNKMIDKEIRKNIEITTTHGTNVAGLAVASGVNNTGTNFDFGICGTAPKAKFVAYRITDKWKFDELKIEALSRNREYIDVYNGSIGPLLEQMYDPPQFSSIIRNTFIDGIKIGRQKKGNIFVFAAGNGTRYSNPPYIGRNSNNNNGFANSRYTIAVSSSDNQGYPSSYSDYGSHVMLNAPSGRNTGLGETELKGIVTTDIQCLKLNSGFTNDFTGTSAAAPVVSGVAALMLAANPELGWRDVQQILIETADKNPGGTWTPNASNNPQYSHDYRLGFGRVNAGKAVALAAEWTPLPKKEDVISQTKFKGEPITIPKNFKIEFVEVTFTSPKGHSNWGNLTVTLRSPHGTESLLTEPLAGAKRGRYNQWTFGSVRHFGEPSAGTWTLDVRDGGEMLSGFNWTLTLHGTKFPPGLPFTGVYGLNNQSFYWEPQAIPTSDGGYLTVVGIYGPGTLLVMKLDSAGGVEWAKILDGNADESQPSLAPVGTYRATEAALTAFSQAGFADAAAALRVALGGASLGNSSSDRGWLLKLDANGLPLWHTRSEEAIAFNDVVETDNHRLVVTGAGYGLVMSVFDATSGTLLQASQSPMSGYYASGYNLIRADDGGFLVQGSSMGSGMWGFREHDVVAAKFDAALQPIWINQYGVADFDEAYTLLPAGQNGAMIGGGLCVNRNFGNMCVGTQSAWWLHLDEEGQVIGSQTRADAAYGTIFSLGQTGDGGYVASGAHYTPRFGTRAFIVKTGGADALFEHPETSCFDAGNPPDVKARPVAIAPVPLDLHVQHSTTIPMYPTDSRTTITDALNAISLEVDLCLQP